MIAAFILTIEPLPVFPTKFKFERVIRLQNELVNRKGSSALYYVTPRHVGVRLCEVKRLDEALALQVAVANITISNLIILRFKSGALSLAMGIVCAKNPSSLVTQYSVSTEVPPMPIYLGHYITKHARVSALYF